MYGMNRPKVMVDPSGQRGRPHLASFNAISESSETPSEFHQFLTFGSNSCYDSGGKPAPCPPKKAKSGKRKRTYNRLAQYESDWGPIYPDDLSVASNEVPGLSPLCGGYLIEICYQHLGRSDRYSGAYFAIIENGEAVGGRVDAAKEVAGAYQAYGCYGIGQACIKKADRPIKYDTIERYLTRTDYDDQGRAGAEYEKNRKAVNGKEY